MKLKKIIFVCQENTCRSIMAEAILKPLAAQDNIEVFSRGLVVLFPEPMNPKAVAVLAANQLAPSKEMSEALTEEDFDDTTLVLTMSDQEKDILFSHFPKATHVFSLCQFAGAGSGVEEITGQLSEYGHLYEQLDLLVKMAYQEIHKMHLTDGNE